MWYVGWISNSYLSWFQHRHDFIFDRRWFWTVLFYSQLQNFRVIAHFFQVRCCFIAFFLLLFPEHDHFLTALTVFPRDIDGFPQVSHSLTMCSQWNHPFSRAFSHVFLSFPWVFPMVFAAGPVRYMWPRRCCSPAPPWAPSCASPAELYRTGSGAGGWSRSKGPLKSTDDIPSGYLT